MDLFFHNIVGVGHCKGDGPMANGLLSVSYDGNTSNLPRYNQLLRIEEYLGRRATYVREPEDEGIVVVSEANIQATQHNNSPQFFRSLPGCRKILFSYYLLISIDLCSLWFQLILLCSFQHRLAAASCILHFQLTASSCQKNVDCWMSFKS